MEHALTSHQDSDKTIAHHISQRNMAGLAAAVMAARHCTDHRQSQGIWCMVLAAVPGGSQNNMQMPATVSCGAFCICCTIPTTHREARCLTHHNQTTLP